MLKVVDALMQLHGSRGGLDVAELGSNSRSVYEIPGICRARYRVHAGHRARKKRLTRMALMPHMIAGGDVGDRC